MKKVLHRVWWLVQRGLCLVGHHNIVEVTEDGFVCRLCGFFYSRFDAQADLHAGGGPIIWGGPTQPPDLHSEDSE